MRNSRLDCELTNNLCVEASERHRRTTHVRTGLACDSFCPECAISLHARSLTQQAERFCVSQGLGAQCWPAQG